MTGSANREWMGPHSRTPGPPSVVIQYVAKCLPRSASFLGRRAMLYSLGAKTLSCAALHQSPCLRVALRLHDLILFDGCIIWMYEDVQGKNSRLANAAAGDGPGVNQAVSVDPEETISPNIKPECVVAVEAGMDGPGTHPGHRDSCPSVRLSSLCAFGSAPEMAMLWPTFLKPLDSGNCPESERASPSHALVLIS